MNTNGKLHLINYAKKYFNIWMMESKVDIVVNGLTKSEAI